MKRIILFALVLGTLASCQKEDVETSESTTISGSAVKGYVESARVDIYEYKSNGERGILLGTTNTDKSGNYKFSANYRGPVEIVVSQGQYKDEATGNMVSLAAKELVTVAYLNENNQTVATTALTTVAAEYVKANLSSNIESTIQTAHSKVAYTFGIGTINISEEIPADLSYANSAITNNQAKYGAVQAGLSQLMKDKSLTSDDLLVLIDDFSKDYSDGILDGKSGTTALESSLTITPAEALQGLNTAINNFLNSPMNQSGYTSNSSGF